MITFEELRKTILKFGLKPTSSREMSFFSFTCIALGYTKFLKEIMGFSYESVGAFGEGGKWHSFFNESHITEATGKFLKKNPNSFDKLALAPARRIFQESEEKFLRLQKTGNPVEQLKIIYDLYPQYFAAIGVYNCFWRYIGNNERTEGLTPADVKRISGERSLIAKFYPKVEEVLKKCVAKIGTKEGFDGNLLLCLTYSEMNRYLTRKIFVWDMMGGLSLRKEKYFYLYMEKGNREKVVTDKKIIDKIRTEFYHVPTNLKTINGFPVYKGLVRGRVYNIQQAHFVKDVPTENFVLVASMTHPDDVSLVKKCVAVITDEGGILSHAAIVAREMKKPCIIGTKIATKVLKDGDVVEVDAEKGIVKIIK